MALRIDEPRPGFYKEVGGGLYASFKTKKAKFAFEFRYGRDIDEKRNRFALTFDFWNLSEMFSKEENREGKNKEENRESENKDEKNLAEKNYKDSIQNKKTNQSLKVMYLYGQDEQDSLNSELHKISNRWFRVTDSTKVLSEVYSPSHSVRAIYTDEICYDESQKSVWIKENFEDVAYAVPMDSLDYCDEVEMEIPWKSVIVEGVLFGILGGMLSESWPVFALAGTGGSIGTWLLAKAFDGYKPKVSSTTCDMPHSRDDVENWLKQYPCKNEFMNRLERDQIFLPQ